MKHGSILDPAVLRQAAEARLPPPPAMDDARHELEVHQIELGLQNEALVAAYGQIQAGLERYTELFDFAPVGYADLTTDGTILMVNHSAAQLLGREREQLLSRRLGLFVREVERPAFNHFMQQVFATRTRQTCELGLCIEDAPGRSVHLTAQCSNAANECHAVLLDITGRRQGELKIHEQLKELLRWQNLMLAREERVQQMKAEVNELLAQQGLPARYPSQITS